MKTRVFQEKFKKHLTAARRHSVIFIVLLAVVLLNTLNAQDNDTFLFYDNDGLTVTGTRQTTQEMTVIGREEIERRASSDLVNLLHESLGLNIVRNGPYGNQAAVNLRGLDSKRIAFLINGIPANSTFDGKFDINQIDLNSIERIEVIYGGSDSRHNISGAMGGVINIITAGRQDPGWLFNFSLSNTSAMQNEFFDTQNYSVSAMYGTGNFSFSANTFFNNAQNHFLYEDYLGQSTRRINNEVWDTGAAVSAIWELPNLTKLIASSNFYYGDKNIPNGFSVSGVDNQGETAASISLLMDAPVAFHDDFASEASLTWHFNRRTYSGDSDNSLHNQNSLLAVNRWSWFPSNNLTFRFGIDYRFIFLNSTDMDIRSRHYGGFYFTAEYKPFNILLIIPSTKIVFSSIGSEKITIVPKLGFLLNVTDSLAVKNNYFRSFKFPEFEELFWYYEDIYMKMAGNPNLRPEDGWGADLGVQWKINNYASLESVFFAQRLIDSIHWFEIIEWTEYEARNVGEAAFFGLDTKLNFNIPVSFRFIEEIGFAFTYKYLLSFMLDDGRTLSSNVRVPYSPEHTFSFSFDVFWRTGSFTLSGHYESVRYDYKPNGIIIELEPYFLMNVGANQKITDNFSAFINLRNILNWSYRSFYGSPPYQDYPMPGFTVTIGLRINILPHTAAQRHSEELL